MLDACQESLVRSQARDEGARHLRKDVVDVRSVMNCHEPLLGERRSEGSEMEVGDPSVMSLTRAGESIPLHLLRGSVNDLAAPAAHRTTGGRRICPAPVCSTEHRSGALALRCLALAQGAQLEPPPAGALSKLLGACGCQQT